MEPRKLVEYSEASPEVRVIYDDIMSTRGTDYVTNYWRTIARHPATLRRTWMTFKEVMADGALDSLTKEMIYLAVSVTNRCDYCVEAHTKAARSLGMSEEMFGEVMAVVSVANGANQLAIGYGVESS